MTTDMQLFPALDAATEAALRASIERFGVIVPVVVDQHGRTIDGHHRQRIADELRVECPTLTRDIADDAEAEELARTLNLDRRHLDAERRRELVAALRAEGHSYRAIAGALGSSLGQVQRDLSGVSVDTPEVVRGADGKHYPATRERIADAVGDEAEVEAMFDTLVDHHGDGLTDEDVEQALEENAESKRLPITKPDLGNGVSHPARYSDELIPVFAELLHGCTTVLDPFAGTGRIHELQADGYRTTGVEIEPEWAEMHPDTVLGDALSLPFEDESFDAICTSPTYGNRLADSHNASDPHLRRSYKHDLGRDLADSNSGDLQWGGEYRVFHEDAWTEAIRVLRPGGTLILNIKDHIRGGAWQDVAGWHTACLCSLGLTVTAIRPVVTRALRQGANSELRVDAELVIAFEKDDPEC